MRPEPPPAPREKEAAGPGEGAGPARASEASPSGFPSPSPGRSSVEKEAAPGRSSVARRAGVPDRDVAAQTRHYAERAEELARSLLEQAPLPPPAGRRALVVLVGLPGSGKSHFGRLLATRLGAVVVASDELRRRVFVAPSYRATESAMVFAVAHAMARELLGREHAVVFDATNLRERDREPLYGVAEDVGARLVVVQVTAPEPEIYARLGRRRLRGLPEDASEADERVYELMRGRYEEPRRPYLVVDTTADLAEAVARVASCVAGGCA